MTGEYVKEHDIAELDISNATNITFDDNGVKKVKVQVDVKYRNQKDADPNKWTMNDTTARTLAEYFGTKSSSKWTGRIPIETSKTAKGYAIFADSIKLKKTQSVLN